MVISGLAVLNLLTRPQFPWVRFVAFGWGVGLLAHALRAFDRMPFLGPQWERRQVEKRLGRQP